MPSGAIPLAVEELRAMITEAVQKAVKEVEVFRKAKVEMDVGSSSEAVREAVKEIRNDVAVISSTEDAESGEHNLSDARDVEE